MCPPFTAGDDIRLRPRPWNSGTLKPIESPGADILIPKLTTTVHISCPLPDFMDPGGSELDSSLPQPDNPCLIVEDSQPDSVGLEDDPESSYRALLARRLSSLQPAARSPVLVRKSKIKATACVMFRGYRPLLAVRRLGAPPVLGPHEAITLSKDS
ncbi:hypothetical protein CRENBAI_021579 [Crenichthys baileyi]|uniref:Uncharacterized protein n=1 Tax=Crenichthys baileyi TaxID=28760 RepID=A0AAV9SN30_9TELE